MDVEPFAAPLEAVTDAVTPSRQAFRAWLGTFGVDEDIIAELTVVFSELVANAVDASPETEQVSAAASVDDGNVVIEVANSLTTSSAPVDRWDLEDPLRPGGRGLLIVRAYTDTLEIDVGNDTIVVRCERQLDD